VRYGQILAKNRRFNLHHLYLAPPLGVTALEVRRDLWLQKTRRIALSCGIKRLPVGSLDWSQRTRVMDRQNYDSQDRASIAASRSKNRLRFDKVTAMSLVVQFFWNTVHSVYICMIC